MNSFPFPKWTNTLRPALAVGLVGVPLYLVLIVGFGTSAKTTAVGYMPVQPVPYSHALHAGQLGIDCRYCHKTVEETAAAAIPATQICMNCHQKIRAQSAKLIPVRESFATGMPVPWIRVHDLPDYVYFNHSAHVRRGVGCVSCHGRIDKMEIVSQEKPLTMGWCLECHRNPEKYLRPVEFVTKLDWVPSEDQITMGKRLREQYGIDPSTDCTTCHR
jgi:menaquinone reductase, multiheme cytochrome c subunit